MSKKEQIRVDILLPLSCNDGTPIEEEKFYQTDMDLSTRFGGCTALVPVKGTRVNPDDGTRYEDILSGFYVIAPNSQETFDFLREYKELFKERFDQKEIMMTWQDIKRI